MPTKPISTTSTTRTTTARDNETTAVTYTSEPQWARPWFMYSKDADGKFMLNGDTYAKTSWKIASSAQSAFGKVSYIPPR